MTTPHSLTHTPSTIRGLAANPTTHTPRCCWAAATTPELLIHTSLAHTPCTHGPSPCAPLRGRLNPHPQVLVGGCDDTKRLHSAGELHKMLAVAGVTVVTAAPTSAATRYGKCGVLEAGAPAGGTLFHFPEVLDNRVVRFNGFWVSVCVSVQCIEVVC